MKSNIYLLILFAFSIHPNISCFGFEDDSDSESDGGLYTDPYFLEQEEDVLTEEDHQKALRSYLNYMEKLKQDAKKRAEIQKERDNFFDKCIIL